MSSGYLPFHADTPRSVAERRFKENPGTCFQKHLIDAQVEAGMALPEIDLSKASVEPITKRQAARFIHSYEYLGKIGQSLYQYGLAHNGKIYGVACFGHASGPHVGNICEGFGDRTIGLLRGACLPVSHNVSSWFDSRACEAVHVDHGKVVIYAYADESAGEIGTIYQALNWMYIGQEPGHSGGRYRIYPPESKDFVTERHFTRLRLSREKARELGWRFEKVQGKHKYVTFEGDRRMRKELRRSLRFPILPYPKRA